MWRGHNCSASPPSSLDSTIQSSRGLLHRMTGHVSRHTMRSSPPLSGGPFRILASADWPIREVVGAYAPPRSCVWPVLCLPAPSMEWFVPSSRDFDIAFVRGLYGSECSFLTPSLFLYSNPLCFTPHSSISWRLMIAPVQ